MKPRKSQGEDKEALTEGISGKEGVDVEQWFPSQKLFIVALVLGYIGAIIPVSLAGPLIPSLEDDDSLNWSKITSGTLIFFATISHSCGNIMLGHLGDVFGGQKALVSYMVASALLMVGFATISIVPVMVLFISLIAWLKGLAWPAVTCMIGAHLPAWHWDIAFLIIGCASRLGSSFCAMFLGTLLNAFSWQVATMATSGVVVLFAILFVTLMDVKRSQYATSSSSSSASEEVETQGAFTKLLHGLQALPGKLQYMAAKPDTWLIIVLSISLHATWIFAEYIAAFAHNIYNASHATAAQVNSLYSAGQLAGLICGFFTVTLVGPAHGRRVLYVSALVTLGLSILVPLILMTVEIQLAGYTALIWALGFLTVEVIYVPIGVFANLEGGPAESASLFIGALDGMSTLLGSGLALLSAEWREQDERQAFFKINAIVLAALCVAFAAFGIYVWRNWNGAVFDPIHDGDDETSSKEASHDTKDSHPSSKCSKSSKEAKYLIGGQGGVSGSRV